MCAKQTGRSKITILIFSIAFVLVSTVSVFASSAKVSIKNHNYPKTIVAGNELNIRGTISSNKKISRIEIGIVSARTKTWTEYKYDNKKVNSKTFSINRANSKLKFASLTPGTYYYRIYAHYPDEVKVVLNKKFRVKKGNTVLNKYNYPKDFEEGTKFTIKGSITSKDRIKRVEIGIVNSSGKWTKYKYDNKKLNAKKFSLSKARRKLKFEKLSPGKYYYRIYAHSSSGSVFTLINEKFEVKAKAPEATYADYEVNTLGTTDASQVGAAAPISRVVSMKNGIVIPNFKDGFSYNVSGMISASDNISRVEIGIVSDNKNAWLDGQKYDNENVNSTTFDVSLAAPSLHFEKLSTGKYYYRIYVHFEDGDLGILTNQAFKVLPGTKNQKAIDGAVSWAIKIAKDDSFTYGAGSRAQRYGCYFCGTNTGPRLKMKERKGEPHEVKGKDGSSHTYEKTYCCNPFIHAAYAHGAGDANMLTACQKGQGIGMAEWTFTRYGNWKNVGKPKLSSLKKGDVLVARYPSGGGHVVMYIGNGMIVEATGGTWSESSIRVSDFTQAKYERFGFVMRYTGTGKY